MMSVVVRISSGERVEAVLSTPSLQRLALVLAALGTVVFDQQQTSSAAGFGFGL